MRVLEDQFEVNLRAMMLVSTLMQLLMVTHLLGNKTVQKVLTQIDNNLPLYLKRLPEDFGEEILGVAKATGIREAD